MSKTSSQHKNFRLICPLHKPCAKTGSLTKQRPSSPFCVAITDKSRRRKIPTCFNQPFRLTLTPMLPKMHPHSSMENSLTAPHQSGRSPTASEQSRQLTNKMPAHPSPRKKPFWRERRAQQKPAVAAIRQPTPNPTHLTAQMGSPPLLIHPASAASTAAPTAAALRQPAATAHICLLRLSCGVLLLFTRCGVGLFLLFNISFIKNHPISCHICPTGYSGRNFFIPYRKAYFLFSLFVARCGVGLLLPLCFLFIKKHLAPCVRSTGYAR